MLVAICRSVINKVSKDDSTAWERLATGFKNADLTQAQLASEINSGHAFTTHHKGRRKGANFAGAGYIALDYDNVKNQDEVQAIKSHSLVKDYLGLFYHTPSATEENPRFRLVFELEYPEYDGDYYRDCVQALIKKLGATADQSCKDPCRLFFGSKDSQPTCTGRVLPKSVLAEIVKEWRLSEKEKELKERASATSRNGQHDKGKDKYLQKVLETQVQRVANAPKGDRHDVTKDAARVLGGYVEGEGLNESEARHRLLYAISGPDVDYNERRKVIDWGLQIGRADPLYIPAMPENGNNQKKTPSPVPASEYTTHQEQPTPTEEKKEPRFSFIRADELDQIPPMTYLINQELPARSIVALYGPSGGGKSFYALDLALRIAQEDPVLYIASEGMSGYRKRVEAWCEKTGLGRGWLYFYPKPANFMSYTEAMSFIQSIKETLPQPPKLMILDTLSWCMSGFGGDENSNKDMAMFLVNCSAAIVELDCTVLVVHHVTKGTGTYRGATALLNNSDMMIELNPDDGLIRLECIKVKDDDKPEVRYLKLEKVGDSCVLVPATRRAQSKINAGGRPSERLLDILERLNYEIFVEKGAKSVQLKEMLDYGQQKNNVSTLYNSLSALMRHGLITQGAKGDPFFITEAGKKTLQAYRPLAVHGEATGQSFGVVPDDDDIPL